MRCSSHIFPASNVFVSERLDASMVTTIQLVKYIELSIGKMGTPLRKEFLRCSNKEICRISTPFNF